MPALDACHPQVVHALEKAGWTVSPMPFAIPLSGRRNPLLADIKAEQSEQEIIIVEVKCFENNTLEELYSAIGQYLVYRHLLRLMNHDESIYLAIPTTAYYGIFTAIGVNIVQEIGLKLLVVDLSLEEIEQWL